MSTLFRAEALAARRELTGPGRLLGRERPGRLWLLLAGLAVAAAASSALVEVPAFAVGAGRVDARTGALAGSLPGSLAGSEIRVAPAGRCASAELHGSFTRSGRRTLVTARLPADCRGRGGAVRIAAPAGTQPLLRFVWGLLT